MAEYAAYALAESVYLPVWRMPSAQTCTENVSLLHTTVALNFHFFDNDVLLLLSEEISD